MSTNSEFEACHDGELVNLTMEQSNRVAGGENAFAALSEWRNQNPWLDASMALKGLFWNGTVYVAKPTTHEAQGVEI